MLPDFKVIINTPFSWIGPVLSVISITIGVLVIRWQIKKNHQQTLKLSLYNQLLDRISSAYNKIIQTDRIRSLPFDINFYWKQKRDLKINPTPIEDRAETLITLNSEARRETIKLYSVLECYEIAIPSFHIFKEMIRLQLELCQKAFDKFLDEVTNFLPFDIPEELAKKLELPTTIIRPAPNKEQSSSLQRLAMDYCGVAMELTAYIYDLSITAQNQILGDLFGRKLPPRKSKDESYFVITAEPSKIKESEEHIKKLKEKLKRLNGV